MKIVRVVCAAGKTGFFFDDQRAIKIGLERDGFTYLGAPITKGFTRVRQAGESISVMLILEDGQIAHGDCAAVQYSGAGGRDLLFLAEEFIPIIERNVAPLLVNRVLTNFRTLAYESDNLLVDGRRLHTAIRYGVTQALLDAVAKAKCLTMAEVIQEEYAIKEPIRTVPIFAQSGDDRYINVDKMIVKSVDVLPHGLINNVEQRLGNNGELLLEYVNWIRERIMHLRTRDDYSPIIHLDVYGTIGLAFSNDLDKMVAYLGKLEQAARPYQLRIEGPMDLENRELQLTALKNLRKEVQKRKIKVELVADEWCNTLEDIKLFVDNQGADMIQIKTPDLGGINNVVDAILYCKKNDVGAYCGGTCNETERSAQICTNIAMACGADQCLAKPGMGVDEGYMVVFNEMSRVMALIRAKQELRN